MKIKITACSAIVSVLAAFSVYAGSATTQGGQAPAIVGDHATVNYGISDETVKKIIALYEKQKNDADYIKRP